MEFDYLLEVSLSDLLGEYPFLRSAPQNGGCFQLSVPRQKGVRLTSFDICLCSKVGDRSLSKEHSIPGPRNVRFQGNVDRRVIFDFWLKTAQLRQAHRGRLRYRGGLTLPILQFYYMGVVCVLI